MKAATVNYKFNVTKFRKWLNDREHFARSKTAATNGALKGRQSGMRDAYKMVSDSLEQFFEEVKEDE